MTHPVHPFDLKTAEDLYDSFDRVCQANAATVLLRVQLSRQRISDAFEAWDEDSKRNAARNMVDESKPDHIKCAAILTYWLRRERPIIDVSTISPGMYSEFETILSENGKEDGKKLTPTELEQFKFGRGVRADLFIDQRKRIHAYANEYLSFDYGFRLAKEYEIQKRKETGKSDPLMKTPSAQFIDDFCYFLKFKSVSPHAVYFIYRSLLA